MLICHHTHLKLLQLVFRSVKSKRKVGMWGRKRSCLVSSELVWWGSIKGQCRKRLQLWSLLHEQPLLSSGKRQLTADTFSKNLKWVTKNTKKKSSEENESLHFSVNDPATEMFCDYGVQQCATFNKPEGPLKSQIVLVEMPSARRQIKRDVEPNQIPLPDSP